MNVELLFWEGCPSHPKALADLRDAMADVGLDPSNIVVREVNTDSDADRERFVGSPTIRVDGLDIQPPREEPFGLDVPRLPSSRRPRLAHARPGGPARRARGGRGAAGETDRHTEDVR